MKILRVFVVAAVSIVLCSTMAVAGDFDWMKQMNVVAQADPTGFHAQLATRFKIGSARVSAIVGNFPNPADAYMVMRLGEMSHHPPEYVMERYQSGKKKGWGAFAKSLGIKPGSAEFHALKRGHDLDGKDGGKGKGKGKGKKDKGKKNKQKDDD